MMNLEYGKLNREYWRKNDFKFYILKRSRSFKNFKHSHGRINNLNLLSTYNG